MRLFKCCLNTKRQRLFTLLELENLEKSSGGYIPDNIAFYTYAKLMNIFDEEIKAVRTSYIILDEFNRCGILNPPKYVWSVFSYQKDLEKYEKRIANKNSKIVRDEGQKYLEALRRTLEQADSMEEIFLKHMTDKQGKYIVFCANYEHMQEMISIPKEWFSKIDTAPHIYSAYSNNPDTSTAFSDFKANNSKYLNYYTVLNYLTNSKMF